MHVYLLVTGSVHSSWIGLHSIVYYDSIEPVIWTLHEYNALDMNIIIIIM